MSSILSGGSGELRDHQAGRTRQRRRRIERGNLVFLSTLFATFVPSYSGIGDFIFFLFLRLIYSTSTPHVCALFSTGGSHGRSHHLFGERGALRRVRAFPSGELRVEVVGVW